MIRLRWAVPVKVGALGLSVMLNGAVALAVFPTQAILIESDAGAAEARIGDSFEDLVQGVQTAVQPTEMSETKSSEPQQPVKIASETAPEKTQTSDPVQMSETTELQAALAPETPIPPTPAQRQSQLVQPMRQNPLPSPATASQQPQTPAQVVTQFAAPSDVIAPITQPQQPVLAQPKTPVTKSAPSPLVTPKQAEPAAPTAIVGQDAVRDTAVTRSFRPRLPSPKAAEKATAAAKAKAAARTASQPAGIAKAPEKPAPQRGGAKSARAGAADGSASARAVKKGTSGTHVARAQGNAAASNYPGKVWQKLSRTRKPRVGEQGVVSVRFTIASSGGLAKVGIARSSGSARLDGAALTTIRRAAPFPKPPPGAQRSFSMNIEMR